MPEQAMELPAAYIEHRLPNRLRVRVPDRRGDAGFFARAAERLAGLPGVHALRVNHLTGCIVLQHQSDVAALASGAAREGLFRLLETVAPPGSRRANPALGAGQRSAPLSLVAAGFAGLGVLQVARGRAFGPAVENLWNAYNARAVLGEPWIAAGLVGVGLFQLARGQVLNSATSLAFYALNARRLGRIRRS